jgi:phosphoenolpyruvate carboxylase
MPERADAIERKHECVARQCIGDIAQHINTLDAYVTDERERQMDVGVDDCSAAGAQGNVPRNRA